MQYHYFERSSTSKICSPNIERNYKLRCFSLIRILYIPKSLNYFSHLVSVICGEFRKNTARQQATDK